MEAELSGCPPGQEAREIRPAKARPPIPGVKLKSAQLLPPQPSASSERTKLGMVNEIEQPGQTPGRHTSVPLAPLRGGGGRVQFANSASLGDSGGSEQGVLAQVA